MKNIIFFLVTLLAVARSAFAMPNDSRHLEAFPVEYNGNVRYVLELPQLLEEEDVRIELVAGKYAMVDCNSRNLKGEFAQHTVHGFGYSFYSFTPGPISSTRMACSDASKRKGLVSGKPYLINYNSRLPVVVYAPEGYKVMYRILGAGEKAPMPRG